MYALLLEPKRSQLTSARLDFSQRTRYFSLYSKPPGCLLDQEGWYSVTPELVANQIAERCRCDTILDALCGVGGNAIAFAKTCQRGTSVSLTLSRGNSKMTRTSPAVIALDISPTRLALARHNAQIYGVADRIEFILADYVSFARAYLAVQAASPSANSSTGQMSRKIDVVFLSPPWGGPSYLSGSINPVVPSLTEQPPCPPSFSDRDGVEPPGVHPSYSLDTIQPIHGADLFHLSRRITKNIAYFLPRNTDLEEISNLLQPPPSQDLTIGFDGSTKAVVESCQEQVEIEEEWMGSKLKALTCYFGGLVDGQGEMF